MSPPAGPGQSPGGVQGAKPLESSGMSHVLVAENGLKYQKILQFTVLQKRPKLHFQCNVDTYFSLFYSCLVIEKSVLRKLSAVLHKN